MARNMREDLRDIYNDFYGSLDDAMKDLNTIEESMKNVGKSIMDTNRAAQKSAGNTADPGKKYEDMFDAAAEAGLKGNFDFAQAPTIETEVITESSEMKPVATAPAAPEDNKPKVPEKSGMEELEELIGLETVKHDVEEMIGLAKVRKMREEKGMKTVPVSLHLVFSGNPGTGKTTVARILAKLYKEIGILSTGQLVETDRSGLVAGYVGQTAIKTQKKIQEAMGGVLFIDEAYTLNQEGENFGQEAIDTILKAMEDHRDEFIVIVAGYTNLMKNFVESNPGLKSRFNKYFEFPDYSAEELKEIFKMQCKKYQYTLDEEAEKKVLELIERLEAEKDENFANARAVRNLFEKIITNQAKRVSDLPDVDEETLTKITVADLEDLKDLKNLDKKPDPIGDELDAATEKKMKEDKEYQRKIDRLMHMSVK